MGILSQWILLMFEPTHSKFSGFLVKVVEGRDLLRLPVGPGNLFLGTLKGSIR